MAGAPPASRSAIVLLFVTALLWSLGGVLIKSVHANPLAVAGGRSLVAVLLLSAYRPQDWRRFSPGALAGAVAYAATVTCFVVANKLTSAANAIFLQYTAPVYVALLGPALLKEPTRRADWLFTGWALAGVALFFCDRLSPGGAVGLCFALLSGLAFSAFIMLLRAQRDASPVTAILYGNALTTVVNAPFYLTVTTWGHDWPFLLTLGAVQLALPYVLYAHALRHVRAMDAALITFIEPILNPVWVALVQHETPSAWSVLGGALVLSAAATRAVLAARRR